MLDLEKMVKLQSEFKELYYNCALVSISNTYVSVEFEWFLGTFKEYVVRDFDIGDEYKYELTATYKDVKFVTLATEEELKNRGLKA